MAGDPTFDRLERKPAYYSVADAIRRRIVSGELAQHSYLPPEQDFADQLGVTRQTLREAVRLLETSGLITRGKRRRLVIGRPSMLAVGGSLREAMILHEVSYRELWELHMALDPGVAALAARSATDEGKQRLLDNTQRMADMIEAGEEPREVDVEFHSLILEAADNRALRLIHDANTDVLYGITTRIVGVLEQWQHDKVLEAHRRIAEAIIAGDAEVAHLWMARHLDAVRRDCENAGLDMDRPFAPHLQALPAERL